MLRTTLKKWAAAAPSQASTSQPSTELTTPLPPTFRRLIARRTGTSFRNVAEIEEVAMLEPGEGEVLIRVAYAGINGGCETFRAQGAFAFSRNKSAEWFALGAEGSGTIMKIGSGVSILAPGQAVTFVGGAFSEFVVAKAALCWPVPAASPEAAALAISGTVANAALKYVARVKPGDAVLVTAAGGATGHFAVQLAQAAGARVVATCGGPKKVERLAALGLARVIDHTRENVADILSREFRQGIDVAYEGVGGAMQRAAWENLRRPGGRLLAVGYISEYPHVSESAREAATAAQAEGASGLPPSAQLFWGGEHVTAGDGRVAYGQVWPKERADVVKAKTEIFEMHAQGRLQAWVDGSRQFAGLESVPDAVEFMLSGQAVGKVVVGVSQ